YKDKGMMATVGRSRAVVEMGSLKFDGLAAWLTWVFVHVWYLVGFRNRVAVLADWFYSYLTYKRGSRLITGRRLEPGLPRRRVEPSEIERDAIERLREMGAEERPRGDGREQPLPFPYEEEPHPS